MNLAMILLFILALLSYFMPTAIAVNRDHPNGQAIFALNLLLGWSLFGWIIALVWALTTPTVVITQAAETPDPAPQRRCPYCAEGIHPSAIKCKHCGSDLITDPRAFVARRD